MNRTAAAIATGTALLMMTVAQPWNRLSCDPATCQMSSDWGTWLFTVIAGLFYLALPAVVLTVVLVAVLGMRSTRDPHDAAVRAALGESQRDALRRAVATALKMGGVGIGGAYAVAGILHVAISASAGWPAFTTDGYLWLVRLTISAVALASLVIAHAVNAARPRRSPVERLHDDARAPEPFRPWRRRGTIVVAALTAAALGVVVGLALTHESTADFRVTNAAGIAIGAAWLGFLALALGAVLPTARRALPVVLARVARWTRAVGLHKPAAVVETRAAAPSRAGGQLVLVLGAVAWLIAALASSPTGPSHSDRWVGTITFGGDFDPSVMPERLAAIDGVGSVVTAELISEWGFDNDLMAVIDPADLRGLDDAIATELVEHPTAVAVGRWDSKNLRDYGGADRYGFEPTGLVLMENVSLTFINADAAEPAFHAGYAYLIYLADGADPDVVGPAIDATPMEQVGLEWSSANLRSTGPDIQPWWATLLNIAIPLVMLGGPLVALGFGAARARRADDATFSALGATARTLRAAIAIEVGAIAAWAVLAGASAGFATRAVMTAAERARLSLTGVITDSYLATAIDSVAWAPVLIAGLVAAVLLGLVAALAARPRPLPAADARTRAEVAL